MRWTVVVVGLLASSCGDDDEPMGDAGSPPTDAGEMPREDAGAEGDAGEPGDAGGEEDAGEPMDAGPPPGCDYGTEDGMIVLEAEDLTLSEDWAVDDANEGFTGTGYIEWTGSAHNNDPTHGPIAVDLRFDAPGRYRLQWHTRIGRGDDATEHNDTWVRFAEVAGYYAVQGDATNEGRVYPRPQCEDDDFLAPIRALDTVSEATCPAGSSRDGYFKVYSSSARDWRWSARTSDRDPHEVTVEIDEPGVYTMELAARADYSQIDRIVIHEEGLGNDVVRDLANPTTPCD